ncbi:MAG: Nramp family divalent metal transporter [Bacillota bacterium]
MERSEVTTMSGLDYPVTVKEGDPVPHEIVPCNVLPPLVWKNEIPEAVDWKKLVGPSFILAAMGLGSGEAVMWPYMAAHYGFGVFWAAVIGCITQYFLNMEIERWTLATGESVLTGFIRTGRVWGPVYIACTMIPYFWPGWATGAGQVVNWFVGGNVTMWAIIGLLACGAALTLGPVVYNTMEKVQTFLVLVVVFVVVVGTILTFNASFLRGLCQGRRQLRLYAGRNRYGVHPRRDRLCRCRWFRELGPIFVHSRQRLCHG